VGKDEYTAQAVSDSWVIKDNDYVCLSSQCTIQPQICNVDTKNSRQFNTSIFFDISSNTKISVWENTKVHYTPVETLNCKNTSVSANATSYTYLNCSSTITLEPRYTYHWKDLNAKSYSAKELNKN